MADKAIQQARKLFADGETREAFRVLCETALEPDGRRAARAVLAELFPPSEDAVEWSNDVLPALLTDDTVARQKAAKALTKVASDEYGRRQRERIAHPDAMATIVKALKSDDAKVAEAAVFAVARVAQFYYRDPRAVQPALKRLHDPKANVRRLAVRAVAFLTREQAADHILPLVADKATAVQAEVATMIAFLARGESLPQSVKRPAVDTLSQRFDQYDAATKDVVVSALRNIGDAAAVEALRRIAATERNGPLRTRIADIIRDLESSGKAAP